MYLVLPYRDLISNGYISNAYVVGGTSHDDASSAKFKTLTKRMVFQSIVQGVLC